MARRDVLGARAGTECLRVAFGDGSKPANTEIPARLGGFVYQVLLSGDHPTLPWAEAAALEDTLDVPHLEPRRAAGRIYRTRTAAAADAMVQRLAWGEHIATMPDAPHSLELLADAAVAATDGVGSVAVRSIRFGDGSTLRRQDLERHLGGALAAAGHAIDLTAPDKEMYCWLGDGLVHIGWLRGERPPGYDDRVVEKRAHFRPISLHPRRAGSLIRLARVQPGGRILDPFCGTGGIVLEAALLGFDAWGSDLDAWMVQGTMTTLTDAATEALDATVFQADIGDTPGLVEGIDAIVTDLPYGVASTTHQEEIQTLYQRAFSAFAKILVPGAYAVVGHRDARLLAAALGDAFEPAVFDGLQDTHEEFVHKSMTRRFAVLRRR